MRIFLSLVNKSGEIEPISPLTYAGTAAYIQDYASGDRGVLAAYQDPYTDEGQFYQLNRGEHEIHRALGGIGVIAFDPADRIGSIRIGEHFAYTIQPEPGRMVRAILSLAQEQTN